MKLFAEKKEGVRNDYYKHEFIFGFPLLHFHFVISAPVANNQTDIAQ